MWKAEENISILSYSKNHIEVSVSLEREEKLWRFTSFYGNPKRNRRRDLWQLLKHLAIVSSLPWVLMGDLNDICSQEVKLSKLSKKAAYTTWNLKDSSSPRKTQEAHKIG